MGSSNKSDFQKWLWTTGHEFLKLSEEEKNLTLDYFISISGSAQLDHLKQLLPTLVYRDFFKLLPREVSTIIVMFLDAESIMNCMLVSQYWYQFFYSLPEVWRHCCLQNFIKLQSPVSSSALHYRSLFLKVSAEQLKPLKQCKIFIEKFLKGHSGRIMALNYNNDDDLLASGSDDRSVSIWDFKTCEGLFLRQPKTVSAVKLIKNRVFVSFFDGAIHSFNIPDNVILQYIGHVSAVYAIDLCEQLSILVSGSADLTVKTWDLHTGQLLTTFAGQHQHWITETRIILNADESYTVISCNNRSCFVRRMDLEHEELYIKRISWENYTIVPHLFVESGNLLKICFQSDDNKDAFIGVYQLQSEVNLVHQYKIAETVKPIQLLLSIGQKLVMAISRGDQYRILYIFGLHSKEVILSKPLPPIRLTHNGSSVVCGPSEWLNGFDVIPPHGLVLAAALQNHIIYSLHWK